MHKVQCFIKKVQPKEIALFALFLIFSNILMWKTFKLSSGHIEIASKAWSDFAATIPLIRSFSLGSNFPPQYPIFAGPPIRYHFVFFALVGALEKTGIPLDWALNSLSSFGFFLLLVLIYLTGKTIFKKKTVGFISVILFLFNGSFGFFEFFKKYPISLNTGYDIITNTSFSSFGPYDGKIVSAFWNLNIYTNQRHLAFAYASLLFLILAIYYFSAHPKKLTIKRSLAIGVLIGLFPFIHLAVFGMMGVVLLAYLALYPKIRKQIIVAGSVTLIIAIPQIIYMGVPQIQTDLINPGYLIDNLPFPNFINYWFFNLGFATILAPLGFIFASRRQRKVFLPFIIFFIVGNIFQLTPSMIDNHKFFNMFAISMDLLSAYFLVSIWGKSSLFKIITIPLFIIIILTGVIDFFPIINDHYVVLDDVPNNKTASFILENTPKSAVFLNAEYIFDNASIAGRKTYLGWPYFPWSLGYDTDIRLKNLQNILNSTNKAFICSLLKKEGLDYIEIKDPPTIEKVKTNYEFFAKNFTEIYKDDGQIKIYDVDLSCDGSLSLVY